VIERRLAFGLVAILASCVAPRMQPAWNDIQPLVSQLSYHQTNADFCGDRAQHLADAMIAELSGEVKEKAKAELQQIEESYKAAEPEYVCTAERFHLFDAESKAASAKWELMKDNKK
jgi:hypothetical protein